MRNKWNQLTILGVMFLFYTMLLSAQESSVQTDRNTQFTRSSQEAADQENRDEESVRSSQQDSNLEERNTQLARSNPDYLVTAGDVYTLAYNANGTLVNYPIVVDSTYRIRISNLGIINAAGRTFRQLKNDAETIVSNNYPLSGVQLVLTQPGAFRVFVNGEVHLAVEISTWALERLSSLTSHMTAYASIRNVTIKSSDGKVRNYDLFKAERLGDLSQNPYLRPDDTITFNRFERQVTIEGAVERPGVYQLLAGEQLNDLIETYGSGFVPLADQTRIELVRIIGSNSISGDKIGLGEAEVANNYPLENYDSLYIPSVVQLRPVFFIEGAIKNTNENATGASVAFREVVSFNQGETFSSVVRRNSRWFTEESDSANAYIVRGSNRIPINLNQILYDANFRSEILIEENDLLIVPFRQYFITVAGAVTAPGRYPYIPDRDWEYYISLAGGFVPERNFLNSIRIQDINGKTLKKTDPITPETKITAQTNHWLYYFNQFAPIITTILSITTTFISLTLLSR
jgi:protein involved in polysaccharide export with SLBB domain